MLRPLLVVLDVTYYKKILFYFQNIPSNEKTPTQTDRAQWGHGLEFLMSCISMSVGLGNLWRFPFVAHQNGGGAFLIPYLIILVIVGKPMYYMDMFLGQFSSRGNLQMFRNLAPGFSGKEFHQELKKIRLTVETNLYSRYCFWPTLLSMLCSLLLQFCHGHDDLLLRKFLKDSFTMGCMSGRMG